MAGAFAGAVAELLDRFAAAGISATVDPRNAAPPVVLVVPRSVKPRTGSMVRGEVDVLLIAPGVGHGDALAHLDTLLSAVWAALPVRAPAEYVMYLSPHTGTELLALQLSPVTADYEHV